jgi:hypothetical protein
MPIYQVFIDDLDLASLEKILSCIPQDKLYIGNDVNGDLVKFSDFASVYANNMDRLIAMFEDIIHTYSLDEDENLAEFMAVTHCINLAKSPNLDVNDVNDVNNQLLKIIIYYVKYMDGESYLRPEEGYWGVIGSRIYPWFAVEGSYATHFASSRIVDDE